MPVFSDSHIHIAHIDDWAPVNDDWPVCAAAHSVDELILTETVAKRADSRVFLSCGIHPQNPDTALAPFTEHLLAENRIAAIGEAGFDLFTAEYKADIKRQREAWNVQLELAERFQKPLVIHCRKALHLIFEDTARLAKIPACVFHSFAGSPIEAMSLVKRGVNAYFSFGKPLLNGAARAIACVRELSLDRLLAETDAPYQRLKNETRTLPGDIIRIHRAIAAIADIPVESAAEAISRNFFAVYAEGNRN
ncbi:MAG: TatD family hydrolase [Treponemataceae bacterium]|nr:MAG: TatD family hydrolase [Treponemataceae bacterium]